MAHSKWSIYVSCYYPLIPILKSELGIHITVLTHSFLAMFVNEHVKRVSTMRSRRMCVGAFCFLFSFVDACQAHSYSWTVHWRWQPDKGQNMSIRTCWRMQSEVGQKVNLWGCSLLLAMGPHQGMGGHPQFHEELLGKPGGFICWQCAVQTCHQPSPPKGRNLPLWGGEV